MQPAASATTIFYGLRKPMWTRRRIGLPVSRWSGDSGRAACGMLHQADAMFPGRHPFRIFDDNSALQSDLQLISEPTCFERSRTRLLRTAFLAVSCPGVFPVHCWVGRMEVVLLGFHASHEQIAPSELLEAVVAAEEVGFDTAMCSDHFAPWSSRQGHSGHAWAWLGAALQATTFDVGVVTSPGQRYHPAVSAQAIATLGEMFSNRFWVALGSGEALNEHVTGDRWPDKETRDARLLESASIIRRLLAGETVTHHQLVEVDRARLWTLPGEPPPLFGAAISSETARTVGGWGDGMITVNQPISTLRKVLDAFRSGGGEGKPMYLQVHLSWAENEDEARRIAHDQWRTNVFPSVLATELALPEYFDQAARFVQPSDLENSVLISADVQRHVAWLAELADLGFERIYLHHVGQEQRRFIEAFGEKVLPELTR